MGFASPVVQPLIERIEGMGGIVQAVAGSGSFWVDVEVGQARLTWETTAPRSAFDANYRRFEMWLRRYKLIRERMPGIDHVRAARWAYEEVHESGYLPPGAQPSLIVGDPVQDRLKDLRPLLRAMADVRDANPNPLTAEISRLMREMIDAGDSTSRNHLLGVKGARALEQDGTLWIFDLLFKRYVSYLGREVGDAAEPQDQQPQQQ